MNFMRNKISRARNGYQANVHNQGPHLTIAPGAVEEAVHLMQFAGDINLSELTFTAENHGMSVESFLDIVVFEVPPHCNSHNCDLSLYGIGTLTHFNGVSFLGLCQAGRLMIDHNIFQGHHTQLMVPSEGSMPSHIAKSSDRFTIPVQNRNYDVMIANCNGEGRRISLSGQVVFDFQNDIAPITPKSLALLTFVALSVCLMFTLLSIKIDRGTRADWEYRRVQNVEIQREESTRERSQRQHDGEEGGSTEESDEDDISSETTELRHVAIA